MTWTRDAKGGDQHDKKHTRYEYDWNTTQRTSRDELYHLKDDIRINDVNLEMATYIEGWYFEVKTATPSSRPMCGRRRKRFVIAKRRAEVSASFLGITGHKAV